MINKEGHPKAKYPSWFTPQSLVWFQLRELHIYLVPEAAWKSDRNLATKVLSEPLGLPQGPWGGIYGEIFAYA